MAGRLTPREAKCFVGWLEIPETECPPNHYRLLDLPLFESNPQVIRAAVQRRIHRVTQIAKPDEQKDSLSLQGYLRKVEAGLLDDAVRQIYDRELAASQELRNTVVRTASPAVSTISVADAQLTVTATPISPSTQVPIAPSLVATAPPASAADIAKTIDISTAAALQTPGTTKSSNSIWPWVAGLMMLNVLVLAALIIYVLGRRPQATASPAMAPSAEVSSTTPSRNKSDTAQTIQIKERSATSPNQSTTSNPRTAAAGDKVAASDPRAGASIKLAKPKSESGAAADSPPAAEKTAAIREDVATDDAEDEAEQGPANPFHRFDDKIQLDEVPAQGAEARSIAIAIFKKEVPTDLILHLDNTAASFDSSVHFELRKRQDSSPEAPQWDVAVAEGDENRSGAAAPAGSTLKIVARIFVDSARRMRFRWTREASELIVSAQLCNIVLIMSSGDWTHHVALREPISRERARTHLVDEVISIPLGEVPASPSWNQLQLELAATKSLKVPIHFLPLEHKRRQIGGVTSFGETSIRVGPNQQLEIAVQLAENDRGELEILMRPRYARTAQKRNLRSLTEKELRNQLRSVHKQAAEWMGKYVQAVSALPKLQERINTLQAQLNAQMANGDAGAGITAGWLQTATKEQGKHFQTIKAARNQIPNTYAALRHCYQIVRIAGALHNSEGLEYRIYSKARESEVDLVVGNGKIAVPTPEFVTILNPGVPGTWYRVDEPMQYEFAAGGGITVTHAERPRQPLQGTWQQRDQTVQVRVGGGETYQLQEDVSMVGPTGELFKLVNVN